MFDIINGVDYYKKVASEIFEVPIEEVTPAQRMEAKRFKFSEAYNPTLFTFEDLTNT